MPEQLAAAAATPELLAVAVGQRWGLVHHFVLGHFGEFAAAGHAARLAQGQVEFGQDELQALELGKLLGNVEGADLAALDDVAVEQRAVAGEDHPAERKKVGRRPAGLTQPTSSYFMAGGPDWSRLAVKEGGRRTDDR